MREPETLLEIAPASKRNRLAVIQYLNWQYDHGPDPNSVTRQKMLAEYYAFLENQEGIILPFKRKEPDGKDV